MKRSVQGFTLIELMVGLVLGMIMSLVMAQLFNNSAQSRRATDDAARVQENARFAVDLLGRTVRIAGFRNDPRAAADTVFPAAAPAIDGSNGSGTASDTLIVRFQGGGSVTGTADNTILDCLGTAVAPDYTAAYAKSYNRFAIATGADGRNALFCSTNPASLPGTELVPGVEAMQVLYGEDTSSPADGTADRFVPFDSLTATTGPDNVVAVRIYLLLVGSENAKLEATSATYPLAGVDYTYSDSKIRRVVTATVVPRNRAP